MQENNGFTVIEHSLSAIPDTIRKHILNHIRKLTDYEPVIGIIGKTGAGKSSLCNALFKGDVSAVSDVSACTREPLRLRISVGRHSLTLVDLPGVGESLARDREYRQLYQEWLPRLDLVLWVMKADDRALSVDEQFYRQVIGEAHRHKVLFVVNQADKIEPCHEWDALTGSPSAMQYLNIQSRLIDIGKLFSPQHQWWPSPPGPDGD
jgi:small GTP-binding protein